VRVAPAAAADDHEWLAAIAWQGEGIPVRNLHAAGTGVWKTSEPVPLYGGWKTSLRLQQGRALLAVPLHLPREPSVPTPGVTRPERFSASFGPDVKVMQTERRDYVPGWLWTPAALLILLACGLFVWAIALGIARVVESEPPSDQVAATPSGAAAAGVSSG
jgi:hypothetical protein